MSHHRTRRTADEAPSEEMPLVLRVINLVNWVSLAAVAAWLAVVVLHVVDGPDTGTTHRLTAATSAWRTPR